MDLTRMIAALHKAGMSQAAIAEECGTHQPTICRAANGVDIRYSTGREIERLYRRRVARKKPRCQHE